MYSDIEKRVLLEGEYITENKSTVRKTAKIFGVGKSTVHKDLTVLLESIDAGLYEEVRKVLNLNLKERHLRGGRATKIKYQKQKEKTLL